MIPYGKQNLNSADIAAVIEALNSPYLTQGPRVGEFEKDLSTYLGCKHVVAVNSATSALHLACIALGVEAGDLVWTSAISFAASANAARYCGADVDFVDIDYETFNMSVGDLERKLREAEDHGSPLPKVVIPVAMAGQPADMQEIRELSNRYGFKVLEDASHALGATLGGYRVGGGSWSDVTVFSFHPVKMITTGEGGACATNDPEIARRIQLLRSHGITRDPAEMESPNGAAWYYEQQELGFNYRITDFQCALGISQLRRLDSFVESRLLVAETYSQLLDPDVFELPQVLPDRTSSFHLYVVRLKSENPVERNQRFESMRANGILVNLHYIPIYRHPYYSRTGLYSPSNFPEAERYFASALSLPIYPELQRTQIEAVVSALSEPIGHQTIF